MRCAENGGRCGRKLQKSLRHLDFSSPAEWERCGETVGGASTFFPLRFHRRNPKSRWRTSEIRFASTTSTQSQPPPYQEVKTAVAPVCRFLLWGRVSIPPPSLKSRHRAKNRRKSPRKTQLSERRYTMPRMSDKRKLELAFFLTESGRVAYNRLCLCCKHECKQSYRAVLVQCGRFEKRRE